MNETLLFVGGPVDGRREAIPLEQKLIVVQSFIPQKFESVPGPQHVYNKIVMRFEHGDVHLAISADVTPMQAFLMMCDKYPPQFGLDLNAG